MGNIFQIRNPEVLVEAEHNRIKVSCALGEEVKANRFFFVLSTKDGGFLLFDGQTNPLFSLVQEPLTGHGLRIYPDGTVENWVAPFACPPANLPEGITMSGHWQHLEYAQKARLWVRPEGYIGHRGTPILYAPECAFQRWQELTLEALSQEQRDTAKAIYLAGDNTAHFVDTQGSLVP